MWRSSWRSSSVPSLFVVQTRALRGEPSWIGWILDLGWLALLLAFFVWAPRLLLHHRVTTRNLVPGAVFTVLGLVILRLISVLLLTHWLNWYSTTYGAFGIVIAIFFWIILIGTVLILAAALSPALAQRRDLLEAHAQDRSRDDPNRSARTADGAVPPKAGQRAERRSCHRQHDGGDRPRERPADEGARPPRVPEHLHRDVVGDPDRDDRRLRRRHAQGVAGRIVAAAVMLEGIAFVAIVTAAVTSTFVARATQQYDVAEADADKKRDANIESSLAEINQRLEQIETMLRSLTES